MVWIEVTTFTALDRTVSARGAWQEMANRSREACVEGGNRALRYGLSYCAGRVVGECTAASGRSGLDTSR